MPRISAPRRPARLALALGDVSVLFLSGWLAILIRFNPWYGGVVRRELLEHPWFLVLGVLFVLAAAATADLYHPELWGARWRLLARLAIAGVVLALEVVLAVYAVPQWRFGRGPLALTVGFTVLGMGLLRLLWRAAARRRAGGAVAVVGDGPVAERLARELGSREDTPFALAGRLSLSEAVEAVEAGKRPLGAELLAVDALAGGPEVTRLAEANFQGLAVVDAASLFAELTGRVPVEGVDPRWFVASGDFSALATSGWHPVQRALDVVLASLLLVLSLPALAVFSLWVLAAAGPPVIYRQRRLGLHRRPFTLLKLRTMRRDAEKDGPRLAAPGDRRAIPGGRFMRRWRLDEIPQLLNVLAGHMSLVGPRPERPELAADLERALPYWRFRYSVRPGLTGWAQINMPYADDDEDQLTKLEYDLFYLRNMGPVMYALVLVRTAGSLVFRPGQ